MSEFIIFALAIAIERLFFAPLSKNATPSLTLLVGFSNFFNIKYFPFRLTCSQLDLSYLFILNFIYDSKESCYINLQNNKTVTKYISVVLNWLKMV